MAIRVRVWGFLFGIGIVIGFVIDGVLEVGLLEVVERMLSPFPSGKTISGGVGELVSERTRPLELNSRSRLRSTRGGQRMMRPDRQVSQVNRILGPQMRTRMGSVCRHLERVGLLLLARKMKVEFVEVEELRACLGTTSSCR